MAAADAPRGDLLVLVLVNGLEAAAVTEVLNTLKNESKKVGTHKRRELFWEAYGALITKSGSLQGHPPPTLPLCRLCQETCVGSTRSCINRTSRNVG